MENLEIKENTETAKVVKEKNAKVVKEKTFLNPFEKGVSYEDFKKELGTKKVAEYCKGNLTDDQIEWIENELKILT